MGSVQALVGYPLLVCSYLAGEKEKGETTP